MSDLWRFALIGKTGNGKSSTGNTILGRNVFQTSPSASSITQDCKTEIGSFDGRNFSLLDTPGIFDTKKSNNEIIDKLNDVVEMLSPGPHVFFIVIKIRRFTKEDSLSVQIVGDLFGKEIYENAVVIFTTMDDLESEKLSLEKFIHENPNDKLIELLNKCNNRYCGFNNRATVESRESQVRKLFALVDQVTQMKMDSFYSAKIFEFTKSKLAEKKAAIMSYSLPQNEIQKALKQTQNDFDNFNNDLNKTIDIIRNILLTFSLIGSLCSIL